MNNKVNNDAQLQRMKALMNYGINESKQPAYSSVEYSKVAADGKLYGIVREGTNYFIKVAKNAKGGLVTENFDYIKIGSYKKELGPLTSETTNQRMYKVEGVHHEDGSFSYDLVDITKKFWKK